MAELPPRPAYRRPSPLRHVLLDYWLVLAVFAVFGSVGLYLFAHGWGSPFIKVALMLVGLHVLLFAAIGLFRLGQRHAKRKRGVL